MEATCPCHSVWRRATRFAAHLSAWHSVPPDQAFILAQLAAAEFAVEFTVDAEGDVRLWAQLPLPGALPRGATRV